MSLIRLASVSVVLINTSCVSLVAPYDATFDQSLNNFSEDTARFTAAAIAGGPQRSFSSTQTVEYYASSYNLLDRLSQRARLTRASYPCPVNSSLEAMSNLPSSNSSLPDDYMSFDCREYQLYAVRYYLDQLNYGHRNDGLLKPGEARTYGGQLQVASLGAIETFLATR